jgi:hypothetical protein
MLKDYKNKSLKIEKTKEIKSEKTKQVTLKRLTIIDWVAYWPWVVELPIKAYNKLFKL